MNDELLKEAGGGNYFDELLARIRDIRSSEKVFWRKVLDNEETSNNLQFVKEIAKYFMDFLETDFHKRKNPRRNIQFQNIYFK